MKLRVICSLTLLVAVALVAMPGSSSAVPPAPPCAKTTSWKHVGVRFGWRVTSDLRHVKVTGSANGQFSGQCRGFAFIKNTVYVSHHGSTSSRTRHVCAYGRGDSCGPPEFANGYNDTGKPFTYNQRFRVHQLHRGDCVWVKEDWHWLFGDGTPVPKSSGSDTTKKGCVS